MRVVDATVGEYDCDWNPSNEGLIQRKAKFSLCRRRSSCRLSWVHVLVSALSKHGNRAKVLIFLINFSVNFQRHLHSDFMQNGLKQNRPFSAGYNVSIFFWLSTLRSVSWHCKRFSSSWFCLAGVPLIVMPRLKEVVINYGEKRAWFDLNHFA